MKVVNLWGCFGTEIPEAFKYGIASKLLLLGYPVFVSHQDSYSEFVNFATDAVEFTDPDNQDDFLIITDKPLPSYLMNIDNSLFKLETKNLLMQVAVHLLGKIDAVHFFIHENIRYEAVNKSHRDFLEMNSIPFLEVPGTQDGIGRIVDHLIKLFEPTIH